MSIYNFNDDLETRFKRVSKENYLDFYRVKDVYKTRYNILKEAYKPFYPTYDSQIKFVAYYGTLRNFNIGKSNVVNITTLETLVNILSKNK